MKVERKPVAIPLPCYSKELDLSAVRCQRCAHLKGCSEHTGSRRSKVPMSRIEFKLVPPQYNRADTLPGEDVELAHINAVYSLCYQTVFGKHVGADVRRFAGEVARDAAALNTTIRVYMLATMVGFQQSLRELNRLEESDKLIHREFSPAMLIGSKARSRAANYAHVCRSQFGTFNLSALDMLTEANLTNNAIETGLLESEVIAGKFIVGRKAFEGGPVEADLYALHENDLDDYWLALEDSYTSTVLCPKKPLDVASVDAKLKRKRFAVKQIIAHLKRYTTAGFAAHMARNTIMPAALSRVLQHFRLDADMFEVPVDPVTNAFEFWKELGRGVQHLRCLRMYYGPKFENL